MSDLNKLKKIFEETFDLKADIKVEKLKYNEIEEWDSIGHMTLISNIEEKFKLTMETDEIVNFSSFDEGKEILKKKGLSF